jgi:hypothetical protein
MNLDLSIIESSLHYNQLNAREKFEVCRFLDYELQFIRPSCFSEGYKIKFENAKRARKRYESIYPFGLIQELPESVDFRTIKGKDLHLVATELYKLENIRIARCISEVLGLVTEDERRSLNKEIRELIRDYNELLLDFKKLENKKVETETRNAMIVNKLMLKGNITLEEFREIRAEIEKKDINYILPNKDILDDSLSSN